MSRSLVVVAFACAASGLIGRPQAVAAVSPPPAAYRWDVQQSGVQTRLYDVSFADPRNGWAVGEQNTILRTTDGGATWKRLGEAARAVLRRVAFQSPTDGWIESQVGAALLHTRDGGETWQPATPIRASSFGAGVPLGAAWVLVDTIGVWRSDDQGQTWQKLGGVPRNDYASLAAIDDKRLVLGGDRGRIALTTDGGATWSERVVPGDAGVEAIQFVTPQLGWITRRYAPPLATIDGGATWVAEQVPISSATPITALRMVDAQYGYLSTNYDVLRTANGGRTWSSTHLANAPLLRSISFPVADEGWAVGEHGFIAHYHRIR